MSKNIISFDVGLKNLALCIINADTYEILFWNVMTLSGTPDTTLTKKLCATLDELESQQYFQNVSCVLIEKQPGRNKTMLRIEAYLHMYFVVKQKKTMLYAPRKKLECTQCNFKGASRENYSMRKKASIAVTKEFLAKTTCNQDNNMKEFFEKSTKKDDLADSLLQSLSHLGWKVEHGSQSTPSTTKQDVFMMIKSRSPTDKQLKSGKFSLSNIKHYISSVDVNDVDNMTKQLEAVKGLTVCIHKHFDNIADCINLFKC